MNSACPVLTSGLRILILISFPDKYSYRAPAVHVDSFSNALSSAHLDYKICNRYVSLINCSLIFSGILRSFILTPSARFISVRRSIHRPRDAGRDFNCHQLLGLHSDAEHQQFNQVKITIIYVVIDQLQRFSGNDRS